MAQAGLDEQLLAAAQDGDLALCRKLLGRGASARAVDADGVTPLHFAANNENLTLCSLLVEAGASVHAEDKWGLTPLALTHTIAPFEYLVEAGADALVIQPAVGIVGRSPLHRAMANASSGDFGDGQAIWNLCLERYGRAQVLANQAADGTTFEQFARFSPELVAVIRAEFADSTTAAVASALDSDQAALAGQRRREPQPM